jgi:DnaJ-class molecular chaperone
MPTQEISPQSCMPIVNEGMPIHDNSSINETKKGTLYLKFDIHFPAHMTSATLAAMTSALKQNEEECNSF